MSSCGKGRVKSWLHCYQVAYQQGRSADDSLHIWSQSITKAPLFIPVFAGFTSASICSSINSTVADILSILLKKEVGLFIFNLNIKQ